MATNPIRIRIAFGAALLVLGVALAGCGGSSSNAGSASAGVKSDATGVGNAPKEWAANANAWPAHNYDLANTRATTQTPINSQTFRS